MPHSNPSPSPSPLESACITLPSFPNNVPTAPLLRISLVKLIAGDAEEEERCWKACQELGFFYLDLGGSHDDVQFSDGLLASVDHLFEVMKQFYELPVEEKVLYDFKEKGSYFGYKGYGEGIID